MHFNIIVINFSKWLCKETFKLISLDNIELIQITDIARILDEVLKENTTAMQLT